MLLVDAMELHRPLELGHHETDERDQGYTSGSKSHQKAPEDVRRGVGAVPPKAARARGDGGGVGEEDIGSLRDRPDSLFDRRCL